MMQTAVTVPESDLAETPWVLPYRGIVGMWCLIAAEAAIFAIFVVAYIFYLGKSLTGPYPSQVLEIPILGTICLLSSSFTAHGAVSALRKGKIQSCSMFLAATVLLGTSFLITTAEEWHHLIVEEGLTIQSNLFGTTYYSLVGLHASHVVVGLLMLIAALLFSVSGRLTVHHSERLEVLSLYWHFVDAVWVVVFLVVYVIGR
jgi:cytochrome c oxidase subunit 3/cytochrome o ubiquinol oxidase subunit 3